MPGAELGRETLCGPVELNQVFLGFETSLTVQLIRCSMFDVERWAFSSIQRTSHTQPRLIQHVCVDHGGRYVFVAEKFLNGANVIPVLE